LAQFSAFLFPGSSLNWQLASFWALMKLYHVSYRVAAWSCCILA